MFEGYSFVDFGCSTGGNIKFTRTLFPDKRGVGIDVDKAKLEKARENGHDAIEFDILQIPDNDKVPFVTMAHFLEHLDSIKLVEAILTKGITIAQSFVHVRQPFFDADGYLLTKGLKLYWSDWRGHRNAATSFDFFRMLRTAQAKGRIHSFGIYGSGPIIDSKNEAVVPARAPIDTLKYAPELGSKPSFKFKIPVFSETVLDIVIDPTGSVEDRSVYLGLLNRKKPFTPIHLSDGYEMPIQLAG